jgi:hypothetical protein
MRAIPPDKQFEISEWVEGQFESADPEELADRPPDLDDCPSWQSDPQPRLTGTVYLREETVYYYAPDVHPRSGWWNMGPLPPHLRVSAG